MAMLPRLLVRAALVACVSAPSFAAAAQAARPVLAVCADPSNLPNSNDKQAGFENRIASLLAADLHADLRYTWNQERRSFFRRTLLAGACDVVIAVPAALPAAMPSIASTRAYFTSAYVAVTRARDRHHFASFDDAWLRDARIGLQLIGVDRNNTPPAVALARRSVTDHITGFAMWSDDATPNPQGRIIDAVARGDIDVAFVWGPFAGYFAKPYGTALRIETIARDPKNPDMVFAFPMAIGVRRPDTALRDKLQAALDRHSDEIDAILRGFGVPLVATGARALKPVAQHAAYTTPSH